MFDDMVINITGILLDIMIGCYPDERTGTQPVEVDLLLSLGTWHKTDELNDTVDYAELCDTVRALVVGKNFFLIETLAKFIADELLQKYSKIKTLTIAIGKPKIYGEKASQIKVRYTSNRRYKVALALGSNLNNPQQQLISAIEFLSEIISDMKVAPIYKSSPYGFSGQNDFYNTCISGYTDLLPQQLLTKTKIIEKRMGKIEQFDNGPRIIDIDIILFDNQIYDKLFLQIPHQEMHLRDFVLTPLADIEPEWQHPQLDRTVLELQQQLSANSSEQFILQMVE